MGVCVVVFRRSDLLGQDLGQLGSPDPQELTDMNDMKS